MAPTTLTPGSARRYFVPDDLRFVRALAVFMLLLGLLCLSLWLVLDRGPLWLTLAASIWLPLPWVAWLAWGPRKAQLVLAPGTGIKARHWRGGLRWRHVQDIDVRAPTNQLGIVLSLHLTPDAPWPLKTGLLRRPPRHKPGQPRTLHISLSQFKPNSQETMRALIVQDYMLWRKDHGLPAETSRMLQERMGHELLQSLVQHMPQAWTLYLVVALNVGVWLLNIAQGLDPFKPSAIDLYGWGANSTHAVVALQEHWRLLTATVLHGGLLHLALNMLGLWGAGVMLNRLYGHARFAFLYLGSALAGSALSLHFSAQQSVSVGASGAVFGVLGAWLLCLWRNRSRLPMSMGRQQTISMAVYVLYALSQGFVREGIDNAAHIGGLLMGGTMAALLPDRASTPPGPQRRPGKRDAAALALALAAIGALVHLASPAHSVNFERIHQSADRLDTLIVQRDAIQQRLATQVERLQQHGSADEGPNNPIAHAITQDLRGLQAIRQEMQGMADTGNPRWDALVQDLLEITQLDLDIRLTVLDAMHTPEGPAQTVIIDRLTRQLAQQQKVAERLRANSSTP